MNNSSIEGIIFGAIVGMVSIIAILFVADWGLRPPLHFGRVVVTLLAKLAALPTVVAGVGWGAGPMIQAPDPVAFKFAYLVTVGILVVPALIWVFIQVVLLQARR